MSDEKRLAMLTEMARKVWPDARVVQHDANWKVQSGLRVEFGCARWVEHMFVGHPRALDALEAALYVLGEPPDNEGVNIFLRVLRANVDLGAALTKAAMLANIAKEDGAMVDPDALLKAFEKP